MNRVALEEQKVQVALEIFDCGAFLGQTRSPGGEGFALKMHQKYPDAPKSPYYLNLRTPNNPKPGPLTPKVMAKIGRLFWSTVCDLSSGIEFNHIAGVPNAGDPFAVAMALAPVQPLSCLQLLKGGRRVTKIVGGKYAPGDVVLPVDDLINRADTKVEAIEVFRRAGLQVRDVLVLVDREQGGREELEKLGVRLHAEFTIGNMLGIYVRKGRVDDDFRMEVLVRYPERLKKYFEQKYTKEVQARKSSV